MPSNIPPQSKIEQQSLEKLTEEIRQQTENSIVFQTTDREVAQETTFLGGWMKSITDSMMQCYSSLTKVIPNDIPSVLHSIAQLGLLDTRSSSRCGVEINAPVEPAPERLDTFMIPPRNDNASSSEMLSLLEPVEITGSIGKF